jgi:hypothetical protein
LKEFLAIVIPPLLLAGLVCTAWQLRSIDRFLSFTCAERIMILGETCLAGLFVAAVVAVIIYAEERYLR